MPQVIILWNSKCDRNNQRLQGLLMQATLHWNQRPDSFIEELGKIPAETMCIGQTDSSIDLNILIDRMW